MTGLQVKWATLLDAAVTTKFCGTTRPALLDVVTETQAEAAEANGLFASTSKL